MEQDQDEPVLEIETVTRRGVVERFGKYRSLGRIGQGGMADVFLAVGRGPAGFNKLVVIKRLRDNVASDTAFRDMFLDEARLAARLNHPNIVQTYEVFEDGEAFYITMEYLEGQPLGRMTRECAKRGLVLAPTICARIISDALCGLHYAHESCDFDGAPLHIVHRDVSPQNIFVTYDGQIKVVDFGIAKAERSNTKTQAGFFKGKAAYMAPEQLEGGPIDRRVDVFTTGIVLWELLVGKKLMAAESTARTLVRLLKEPIPRVSDRVAEIDPELDEIVARALAREPDDRYQTAGEMRDALERYLASGRHFVRHEDIGRIVGDVFGEARAERQRQVGEQMALSSAYPPSGMMPAVVAGLEHAGAPTSVEASQLASMSGISVSRTVSSVYAAPASNTGLIAVAPPARGVWVPVAAVAAIAVISVAVVFAMVERTRPTSTAAGQLPAAAAAFPPPAARPASTVLGASEAAAESVHADPSPPAPAPQPAARSTPAGPAWRPSRVEVRQPPAPRAPPLGTAPTSQETTGTATPSLEAEPVHVAPPSPPPAPATSPTQEGRKFRTSL